MSKLTEELEKIGIVNHYVDKGINRGVVLGIAQNILATKKMNESSSNLLRKTIPYRIGQRKIGSTMAMINKKRVV